MPRVTLTAAQREAAKKQDRAKKLADGLLIHKALGRLTYEQMAQQLGIPVLYRTDSGGLRDGM